MRPPDAQGKFCRRLTKRRRCQQALAGQDLSEVALHFVSLQASCSHLLITCSCTQKTGFASSGLACNKRAWTGQYMAASAQKLPPLAYSRDFVVTAGKVPEPLTRVPYLLDNSAPA